MPAICSPRPAPHHARHHTCTSSTAPRGNSRRSDLWSNCYLHPICILTIYVVPFTGERSQEACLSCAAAAAARRTLIRSRRRLLQVGAEAPMHCQVSECHGSLQQGWGGEEGAAAMNGIEGRIRSWERSLLTCAVSTKHVPSMPGAHLRRWRTHACRIQPTTSARACSSPLVRLRCVQRQKRKWRRRRKRRRRSSRCFCSAPER